MIDGVILLFRIFKTLSIPNRKSRGAEILSGVRCHTSYLIKKNDKVSELVGGVSFINGATLSSYIQRREKAEFPLLDPALAGLKGMEKYQSINKSN